MTMNREDTLAVFIDFQEKLMPVMFHKEELQDKTCRLAKGLAVLEIPHIVTQQYTKGIGETIPEIAEAIGEFEPIDKTTFSCMSHVDFINQLEMKNEGVIFKRIDEDLSDALKTKNSAKVEEELKANEEELAKLFKKIVKKDNIKVKLEKLKNKDISAMMTMSGETRKMQEMMRMYASGMGIDEFSKEGLTLVLNANNKLVQFLIEEKDGENVNLICEQLFDLALIQHGPLSPDEMTKFVQRSNKIMMILAK